LLETRCSTASGFGTCSGSDFLGNFLELYLADCQRIAVQAYCRLSGALFAETEPRGNGKR
jgi:hypothetical protein